MTGKARVVPIHRSDSNFVLSPGEQVILHQNRLLIKEPFDITTKTLWKDGVIYFDDIPLNHAIESLERWYGVDIIMNNKPDKALFCTGKFDNDYLSNVLMSLAYSLNFNYKIDDKKIYINFKPN